MKFKITLLLLFCFIGCYSLLAQEEKSKDTIEIEVKVPLDTTVTIVQKDSSTIKRKKGYAWNNLPYFFDDLMIVGGFNRSGLYYTVNYLELAHKSGYQIGIENYTPLLEKAFLHYGVIYANRGFLHERHDITFTTHNIDVPIFLAYELPAYKRFDWRFFVGTQFTYLAGASSNRDYPAPVAGEEYYRYFPNEFLRFDWGFSWGSSMEYKNFYWRFRSFSGVRKLMPNDQGMNSNFNIEIGYFPFRSLRK